MPFAVAAIVVFKKVLSSRCQKTAAVQVIAMKSTRREVAHIPHIKLKSSIFMPRGPNAAASSLIRISFITEDVGNRPPMLTEGRKRTQHAEVLSGVKPFRWTPKRKSGVESNSAVWTATIASKVTFCSIFRDLPDLHAFAPLQIRKSSKFRHSCQNFDEKLHFFSFLHFVS